MVVSVTAVEHHAVQMRQAFFTEKRLRPFDAPIGVVAKLAPELIGREPFALVHDVTNFLQDGSAFAERTCVRTSSRENKSATST